MGRDVPESAPDVGQAISPLSRGEILGQVQTEVQLEVAFGAGRSGSLFAKVWLPQVENQELAILSGSPLWRHRGRPKRDLPVALFSFGVLPWIASWVSPAAA